MIKLNDSRLRSYSALFSGLMIFNFVLGSPTVRATDNSTVDRGRYLVKIAGCNDCHTPGYSMSEGKTPEELWLIGDAFGWRGPWGTTYASNLRNLISGLTEQQWVSLARTSKVDRRCPGSI